MKTALWFLLIEVAVLVVTGAGAVLVVQWRRARRDQAAVAQLVAAVRGRVTERRAGVRDLLGRTGMLGQVLEDATDRILGSELRLYEVCANAYLDRDATALARLNEAVDAAIAPYWALGVSAPSEADVVVTQPADQLRQEGIDPAEHERLKDENQRLSAELQVTLDTMSRMLSEYSAMFAGGADAAIDKEKLREMFASESTEEAEPPAGAPAVSGAGAGREDEGATVAAPPLFDESADDRSDASSRLDDPDLVALDAPESTPDLVDFDAVGGDLDLGPPGPPVTAADPADLPAATAGPDPETFDAFGVDADRVAPPADRTKALG